METGVFTYLKKIRNRTTHWLDILLTRPSETCTRMKLCPVAVMAAIAVPDFLNEIAFKILKVRVFVREWVRAIYRLLCHVYIT